MGGSSNDLGVVNEVADTAGVAKDDDDASGVAKAGDDEDGVAVIIIGCCIGGDDVMNSGLLAANSAGGVYHEGESLASVSPRPASSST